MIRKKQISFGFIIVFMLLFFSLPAIASDISDAIVKVYAVSDPPDYLNPWNMMGPSSVTGSGAVIEGNRILTNAHVVSDLTFIQVRRYGDTQRYPARLLAISHPVSYTHLDVYKRQIAGNLVLLYIVNHLMKWHVSFITEDFYKVLPYMNWSIGASIVVNILYIFFDQKFIRLGTMPVLNIISLLSVFMLFKVFPFDFKSVGMGILNQIGKILLGLVVVGVIIGIIVDWYKLIRDY